MAIFTYQGFPIHYTREGEGKTIIFIHGLGGNSSNWLYQRNQFKDAYQVIAIDLPGHGKSEGGNELSFYDYQDLLKDLLLEELAIQDMLVCGISMGGKAAIDFTSRYPGSVRGLFVADTFASLKEEEKKRRIEVWNLIHQPGGVDLWMERVIHEMGFDPQGPIAKGFQRGIQSNQLELMFKLFMQILDYDQRDQLEIIHVPSVVIHGERDDFIAQSSAEDIHRGLEHSEFHIVSDCGHLPNVEQPKVFNDLLAQLVRKVLG